MKHLKRFNENMYDEDVVDVKDILKDFTEDNNMQEIGMSNDVMVDVMEFFQTTTDDIYCYTINSKGISKFYPEWYKIEMAVYLLRTTPTPDFEELKSRIETLGHEVVVRYEKGNRFIREGDSTYIDSMAVSSNVDKQLVPWFGGGIHIIDLYFISIYIPTHQNIPLSKYI